MMFASSSPKLISLLAALAGVLASARAEAQPVQHPTLYYDASGLAAIQQKASDPTLGALGFAPAAAFASIRDQANGYRAARLTYTVAIPNPNGVGSVVWTYTMSSSDPPPHPNNPSYPPWTGLSRQIQQRMETLSFVYAVTGDPTYLSNPSGTGALDIALQLSAWSVWSDPGYGCYAFDGQRSCLDTSHLTQGAGMVYDAGFGGMTPAQRSTLAAALSDKGLAPLAATLNGLNRSPANPGAYTNGYALLVAGLAVGAGAVRPERPADAALWLEAAYGSALRFIETQGSDGSPYEGHEYGDYAVGNLVIAADALLLAGAGNLYDSPWLGGITGFVIPFLGANLHSLANFGDSTESLAWFDPMFALAHQGDGLAQWYLITARAEVPRDFHRFIWSDQTVAALPPAGSGTAMFPDAGHAALRAGFAGAPVVAFKSGPYDVSVGHNHYDANSFIVNAGGSWVAADPGYRDYFNVQRNLFTSGSIGHNTILVDGAVSPDGRTTSGGQTRLFGGSMEALFDGQGYASVLGHAAATYASGLLDRFDRQILYAKPDVVIVLDDISAPAAHRYSFLLHGGAGADIRAIGANMLSRRASSRLETFFASSVSTELSVDRYPGAESYGPYAHWRSDPVTDIRFTAALVPARSPHAELANPGFEQDLDFWSPRFSDGSHAADSMVARSGTRSARIRFSTASSGYYYSERLAVRPGARIEWSAYYRTAGASGSVTFTPYYLQDGLYIANPGGHSVSAAVSGSADWRQLAGTDTVPMSGVNEVRIALQFNGAGTVWFDDAAFRASPSDGEPALSLGSRLGGGEGVAVRGAFGTEAAGRGPGTGTVVLPASDPGAGVTSLGSDGAVFSVGLDPSGQLVRAYLQAGTDVSLDGQSILSASSLAWVDLAISAGVLAATELPGFNGGPYTVRAAPASVTLNGLQVPFVQQGPMVTFPAP